MAAAKSRYDHNIQDSAGREKLIL